MAETNHAHTEAPGGATTFPPFQKQTYPSQLFWLALTFIALYVILARVALPRIEAIFTARRERIDRDLGDAQTLKTRSDEVMARYEKQLAEARARAQGIANETHQRLNAESEERRRALESKLNDEIAAAERAIAATRARAMEGVHAIAAEAAAAIVERLIGAPPADSAVKRAVDTALEPEHTPAARVAAGS